MINIFQCNPFPLIATGGADSSRFKAAGEDMQGDAELRVAVFDRQDLLFDGNLNPQLLLYFPLQAIFGRFSIEKSSN